jgi:hypothetical protein
MSRPITITMPELVGQKRSLFRQWYDKNARGRAFLIGGKFDLSYTLSARGNKVIRHLKIKGSLGPREDPIGDVWRGAQELFWNSKRRCFKSRRAAMINLIEHDLETVERVVRLEIAEQRKAKGVAV